MVQFILAGSVLLKQPKFAEIVGDTIREKRPQSVVAPLAREAAWGGIHLTSSFCVAAEVTRLKPRSPANQSLVTSAATIGLEQSPTEIRNPRSKNLDKLSARAAIDLFIWEEKYVQAGLKKAAPKIERALALVVVALKKGGRLFMFGAGTSGRPGVLDASECPPTFRTDPEMVQKRDYGRRANGALAFGRRR